MGNILRGGGTEEKKTSDIGSIADKCYEDKIKVKESNISFSAFHRAICEIVQQVNHLYGNTQLNVPLEGTLQATYDSLHLNKRKLTKDEFGKCVQKVIREAEFSGYGAKDSLIYIFGVPTTALLIKHTVMPRAVSNDYFIPAVTSATALVLAKLNKI